MNATGLKGTNAEAGRLSERIWPQALYRSPSVPKGEVCAREARLAEPAVDRAQRSIRPKAPLKSGTFL